MATKKKTTKTTTRKTARKKTAAKKAAAMPAADVVVTDVPAEPNNGADDPAQWEDYNLLPETKAALASDHLRVVEFDEQGRPVDVDPFEDEPSWDGDPEPGEDTKDPGPTRALGAEDAEDDPPEPKRVHPRLPEMFPDFVQMGDWDPDTPNTRELSVKLRETEVNKLAREMARKMKALEAMLEEHKRQKATLKGREENLRSEIADLRNQVANGERFCDVEVLVVADYKRAVARTLRLDTFTFVDGCDRPLSPSELEEARQVPLPGV